MTQADSAELSILRGPPLSTESGLGALTLGGYLREITTRFGPREALVMHEGNSVARWTYTELWERSMAVARALVALGVTKDTRVGILMTNRPEFMSATFGVALAGGVGVMLNTFSTLPELDYMLKASSVSIVLFEGRVARKDFVAMLGELEPDIITSTAGMLVSMRYPFLRYFAVVGWVPPQGAIEGWDSFLARGAPTSPALIEAILATVNPTDMGAVFFSSGSTARPKGILSAHRGIVIQLWRFGRAFKLIGDVRAWTPNGFFWSGNFATVMGATMSVGGALVLQQTFIPNESLQLMEGERVNFPMVWPHQGKQLEEAPNWKDVDLSAMYFVSSETSLGQHPSVIQSPWEEAKCSYGSTETFTISTGFAQGTPPEVARGSHGTVLPGNTLKIIDPISGEILPRDTPGEIAVKGPTTMIGYLGVPIEEAFDAEGFYRTGDAGYLDKDGRMYFQGRLSTVIKTGGANVSPREIDGVLETYPGVKSAHTVGVPHDTLGEIVVACLVPVLGTLLDPSAVQNFAREHLASYKVPRRVLILSADEVALTGSAKVKQAELRKLAAARLTATDSAGTQGRADA